MKLQDKYKRMIVILLCICMIVPNLFVSVRTAAATATKGICTAATSLNVRTGPGTSYAQVKVNNTAVTLSPNQEVTILSSKDGWYQIKGTFKGTAFEGYALSTYIKDTKVPVSTASTQTTTTTTTYSMNVPALVTATELNLRDKAGTKSTVVGTLVNGNKVNIQGDVYVGSDRWYKVKATISGKTVYGYMMAKYVKISPVNGFYGKVTSSSVNMQKEAGSGKTAMKASDGTTLALKKGREVFITSEATVNGVKWLYVRITYNSTKYYGYIPADQVSLLGVKKTTTIVATPTPAPTATPTPTVSAAHKINLTGTVNSSSLNVRKGASTSTEKAATLAKNATVTILTEKYNGSEKWYQVSTKVNSKTITGYVLSDYITIKVGTGFYAKVKNSTVTYKVSASSSAATLKTSAGAAITAKQNAYVWVSEEKTVNGKKWFRISAKISGTTYFGYVPATELILIGKKKDTTASTTPTATPTPTPTPSPQIDMEEAFQIPALVTATTLNLRSQASTSSSKVLAVLSQNTKVTILNQVIQGGQIWYRVAATVNKKQVIGYVYSPYVKLTLSDPVCATAMEEELHLRSAAKTTAGYVKLSSGTIASFTVNDYMTIIKEETVSGVKWFQVKAKSGSETVTGYVLASSLALYQNGAAPTATPTPEPTATPLPTATPTPAVEYFTAEGIIVDAASLGVKESAGYGSSFVKNSGGYPVMIYSGSNVTVLGSEFADTVTWYKISFLSGGVQYTGYINKSYVKIDEATRVEGSLTPSVTATPAPTQAVTEVDFEAQLTAQGFPESYKPYLRALHEQYPNFQFEAYHTGLDWNTVITNENIAGKNLIPNSKGIGWKSLESGAYNWKTDSFYVYDGSSWVTASKEAVSYYMDPRNFLTESGIFQFEVLAYNSEFQNLTGIENILKGTPMYQSSYTYIDDYGVEQTITYAQTFIQAALYSGVSPYHLASRVKQEVISSSTSFSNSVSGTVSGFEGLYNFYNIGAFNSTVAGGAIANGLKYAKSGSTNSTLNMNSLIPWTNRYRSIVGGAFIIGSTYINRGQDTIYLQKFNVTSTSTYSHQYMSNVEAPYSEAKKVFAGYSNVNEHPIVFSIPVYLNMPVTACPQPGTVYNPNNYLKTLTVTDGNGETLALTPTFDILTTSEFSIVLPMNTDTITIAATCVSSTASASGAGTYAVNYGLNEFSVNVTAQNGDIREYKINIVRESE